MIAANVSQAQPDASAIAGSSSPLVRTIAAEAYLKTEDCSSNVVRLDGYVPAAPTRRTRWPKR